jgi:hypothetical protein
MMARRWLAALMVVLVAGFVGSAVANAARGGVTVSATFNGQDIAAANTTAPLRLEPGTLSKVVLDVTNRSSEAVVVKRVELSGHILGLKFFKYVASTELTVQPGATGQLSYHIDLTDLERQATGLVRGDLKVTDDAGRVITTIPTVTDVRGSLFSVTGLFGLALIAITASALLHVALAVARHRLPANRGQRGLRFLLPGVGLLLVVGFTASVLRLWTPPTEGWFAAAGISAAVFFALGFFSPMPGDDDDDFLDDVADLDTVAEDQHTFEHDQSTFGHAQSTFAHDQSAYDQPTVVDGQVMFADGRVTFVDDQSTGAVTVVNRSQRAPDAAGR